MTRHLSCLVLLLAAVVCGPTQAQDGGTLKKIADKRSISLGYRLDAAPFSFLGPDALPAGYSVDLCKRVVASLEQQLKVGRLTLQWVPVTSKQRIAKVVSGEIDLECGTTTVTLGRSAQVDFSSLIFVDGASFLTLAGGPRRLAQLAGRTVGVLPGSTTETRLQAALRDRLIDARIVRLKDETDGVQALLDKRIDAFANDRLALVGRVLLAQPDGGQFAIAEEDFAIEPYALVMRRDAPFRLAVNRALARLYGGPALAEVYAAWFGKLGQPSPILSALYLLHAFDE